MDSEFNSLKSTALKIADDKLLFIAKNITKDLQIYSRTHRRSGDLLKNIKYSKGKQPHTYKVDAGKREDYNDKSYHAITFFVHDKANKALAKTIEKARDSLK